MKLPAMTAPCAQCPFRKDTLKGWLGAKRMKEICEADTFVCHKTTHGAVSERKQCAGHMLLKGQANTFVQLAGRLNQPLKLTGKKTVFETVKDCINHHKNSKDEKPRN
jgi:hypothetical protein